jgi:hypothetical protein
MMFGTW